MSRSFRDFGEEMEDLGKRFERRYGGRRERRKEWWFNFGFVGPLIGSIFSLLFLIIGIWILDLFNSILGSVFVSALTNFIFVNLNWFFAAFLFFGYNNYLSRRYKSYWIISPITGSIGAVIVIWLATVILNLINTVPRSSLIATVSNLLSTNLAEIFVLFLVLGYVVTIIRKIFEYSLRC
jgi:uncharacterized membrane protein YeaQ/YmgE (transglycosylase-associated protein family)